MVVSSNRYPKICCLKKDTLQNQKQRTKETEQSKPLIYLAVGGKHEIKNI